MPVAEYFYARAFKGLSEGLYKIYVRDGALYGAKLAGVVYDEASARAVTLTAGPLGFVLGTWMGQRAVRKRAAREQAVDALEPGSPPFLTADKANFALGAAQITKARVFMPQGLMARLGDKTIAFEITLRTGSKRFFGLVGEPGPERVRHLLTRVVANVESS